MFLNFQNRKVLLRGLLTATVLALAAKFLSSHYKAPAMLFALLLGLSFHFVYRDNSTRQGIDLTADFILKLAVGLLGFRLSFDNIQNIGVSSIFLVSSMVFLTIGFGLVLAKIFKKEENEFEEEKNINATLLLESDNEEAMYMLIDIKLEKSDIKKVEELKEKFKIIYRVNSIV